MKKLSHPFLRSACRTVAFLAIYLSGIATPFSFSAVAGTVVNLSTRAFVGAGAEVLIPGFVLTQAPERLLLRVVGPGLRSFGVSGVIERPSMSLRNAQGIVVATNTGWSSANNSAAVAAAAALVGAFPLAVNSTDCALLLDLQPGNYSIVVSGVGDTSGICLAEIYTMQTNPASRLTNIATRGLVSAGEGQLISGFVVRGQGRSSFLLRGAGPSLAPFGITNALSRPVLQVFDEKRSLIAANSGWSSLGSQPDLIEYAATTSGAYSYVRGSADSALLLSLLPGLYTVQLGNGGGGNGVGLTEVYVLPAPTITMSTPTDGANRLSGKVYNVDPSNYRVTVYALTNQFYVQPLTVQPLTSISADGSWSTATNPWRSLVAMVVEPNFNAPATSITNPAFLPGVLAATVYPVVPTELTFSNYRWGIKYTGTTASDRFDPGPNYWSSDSSVVNVQSDGLHLRITRNANGTWSCSEVFLKDSLGYGTYRVQVSSRLDNLDRNVVASPLFLYADLNNELDVEFSGVGGLIPAPNNGQFVAQPYTRSGNLIRYVQPQITDFSTQIEWRPGRAVFTTWRGMEVAPTPATTIMQWVYTGPNVPVPGAETARINLWLQNGAAPSTGQGAEMIIRSFNFTPLSP